VASMLSAQTGRNITADAVKVASATRRLQAPAPSLRGSPVRQLGDDLEVKYFVSLDGEGAPEPEDAARVLVATDPAVLSVELAAEMALQGFEPDLAVEVIKFTAEAAGAEGGDHGRGGHARDDGEGKNCSGGGGRNGGRGHGHGSHGHGHGGHD